MYQHLSSYCHVAATFRKETVVPQPTETIVGNVKNINYKSLFIMVLSNVADFRYDAHQNCETLFISFSV